MLTSIIGFGILGAILAQRQSEQPPTLMKDQVFASEESVQSVFPGKHYQYPRGADDLRIFGGGYSLIHAQGNPEPRNPMNQLFTYPQSKASSHINKNNEYWMQMGMFDKRKQLEFIDEKISEYDNIFLTPQYKQLNGKTKPSYPKLNLKYWNHEEIQIC